MELKVSCKSVSEHSQIYQNTPVQHSAPSTVCARHYLKQRGTHYSGDMLPVARVIIPNNL
jgi:hypothetical protein